MNDREYSKKTWIVTAIMAVAAIVLDVVFLASPKYAMMRETSVITIAIAVYVLILSIKKIIEKTKQEKQNQEKESE